MEEEQEPPSPAALTVSALIFYVVMAVIGVGLVAMQGSSWVLIVFGDGQHLLRDTAAGAIAGLAVVGLTRLSLRLEAVRALNDTLREMLGSPGTGAIAVLAVSSAIGEELLFRGALQPTLGLVLTSVIFAALHGGLNPRFRLWALFALGAGLLLGGLTLWTGNLLAAILCHLTVNYFNLHTLIHGEEQA
jgi:membrane protease YdiL (CAAX protease family)